ncbi:MAG: hypothetical protein ACT4OE_00190 [Sphingosinicella sp.]
MNIVAGGVVFLAAAVWTIVLFAHIDTAIALRNFGVPELVPLQHLLPLLAIIASAWLLWKNRAGAAIAVALPTLLMVCMFWVAQGVARGG